MSLFFDNSIVPRNSKSNLASISSNPIFFRKNGNRFQSFAPFVTAFLKKLSKNYAQERY